MKSILLSYAVPRKENDINENISYDYQKKMSVIDGKLAIDSNSSCLDLMTKTEPLRESDDSTNIIL